MNEAKLPPHKFMVEGERGPQEIHPDWTMVVSNQLTLITQQSSMLENQKRMIDALEQIAGPQTTQIIVGQQAKMINAIDNLAVHMDTAREELELAVQKLSGSVLGIIKVPIVVTVIGIASFGFFFHYISEHTWLILLAVSVFPYLGDSITAVTKLLRGQNNGRQEKK